MTSQEARAARTSFERVREILHREWDPVGGVPRDEYDSYIWPVVRLLKDGGGRDAIARHLRWAADEQMKSPVPEERLQGVLDSLLEIEP